MEPDNLPETAGLLHEEADCPGRGSHQGNGTAPRAGSQYSTAASARHMAHKHQLGLKGLVCLIFLEVAGGPFGTEDAVSAAGPLLAILGFIVLPFVWSIPEAMICAELATAFPENSGYVVWVESAFGPYFGFLEGLFSWVSGVTDNTVYPIMLLSYLKLFWPQLGTEWIYKLCLMGSAFAMTALNYSGLDIVGKASEVIVVLVLTPFVVLMALALPKMDTSKWWGTRPFGEVNWLSYINIMFWNLNSWDCVSTLAGEVPSPTKNFPKAMFIAVQVVIATYLLPLMVGLAVTDDVDGKWKLGYYGHVADKVGGPILAAAITFAAAVSQVGMFEAEMSADSYQILGMAERGYLPASFGRRSRFGTPTIGILLSSLGIFTMLSFSFLEILEMLNVVYAMAELIEFGAFVWLRISQPNLWRGFKVPLPPFGLALMLLPGSALLLTVMTLPFIMRRWHVVLYTVAVALLGTSLYASLQLLRRSGRVSFEPAEVLARDRWRPETLALAIVAFPAFCAGVATYALTPLDAVLSAAAATVGGLLFAGALIFPVVLLLRYESRIGAVLMGGELDSIPEDGTEARLMRAFLRDSLSHVESMRSRQDTVLDMEDGSESSWAATWGGDLGGNSGSSGSLLQGSPKVRGREPSLSGAALLTPRVAERTPPPGIDGSAAQPNIKGAVAAGRKEL